MNSFAKLSLRIRVSVVLTFLAASVLVGILGRPSRMLLLASALLFITGAWRISKARGFVLLLILLPAFAALLLTRFDWHHPFLIHYSAGLFSVIAALLLMDGIRIEEWIELVRGRRGGFSLSAVAPLLIGTAVGTISLAANIQEQRTCRRLARIYAWRTKSRTSIFLDGIALPFYNAVEAHEVIDEALHRWSPRDGGHATDLFQSTENLELSFGNSSFAARLQDLDAFPLFADVKAAVLSKISIPEAWRSAIDKLVRPATILVIGDYTGQFTKYVREQGFNVTALPGEHSGAKPLSPLPPPYHDWRVIQELLEEVSVKRHDHVLLYHNAFLQAVNQIGLSAVVSRLRALSPRDGRIYFDYPIKVMPADQGTILSDQIPMIGEVGYRYSRHRQDNGTHAAWVEYTIRREGESFRVYTPLRFVVPDPAAVLDTVRHASFACRTSPLPDAFSLLGGELMLVELQNSGEAGI